MDGMDSAPDQRVDATVPIVCTLTTKEAAKQGLEWTDLRGRASTVSAITAGARMTFPASMAAQVEDLAARERDCCNFLTIVTSVEADTLTMEVTSANPDGIPVIALLAGIPLDS